MSAPTSPPHVHVVRSPLPGPLVEPAPPRSPVAAYREDGTRRTKPIAASQLYFAEIMGQEALKGQRMPAGELLSIMDGLAGKVAKLHSESRVVTLMFDRVDMIYPIMHQDLLRLEGRIVHVGNSTMVVEVNVFRFDLFAREYAPTMRSFITMVAINDAMRPHRNFPGLAYTAEEDVVRTEVDQRRRLRAEWLRQQEAVDARRGLRWADVEDDVNRGKMEHVNARRAAVSVQRVFLPRHVNTNGAIFGGDILEWMDRVSVYAAVSFTRNKHMISLAMNRILFKHPLYFTDIVRLTARVVYVRTYTVDVEVEVHVTRTSGERFLSHSGYFTVLNYDEAGFKARVVTGLAIDDDDQEALRRYVKARVRREFWRKNAESFKVDTRRRPQIPDE